MSEENRSMVKALITGGTGFIGSHVVRALITAGRTARVLHRQNSPLDLVEGLPIEHAIGDVMNISSLEQAMQVCQWVFHVAAVSDYWRSNRTKGYLVNLNGTVNVLNAARQAGVQRVIFTSSATPVGFLRAGHPSDETAPFNFPPPPFPHWNNTNL